MALVGTSSLPMLLDLFGAGKLDVSPMVTHGKRIRRLCVLAGVLTRSLQDFKFAEVEKAYDVFGRAAETKALKVNIEMEIVIGS
jgi:alcohol dehydrogenase